MKYDGVYAFSEDLALVKTGEKFGFIDKTGKEVIPLIYDDGWEFSDGLSSVKNSGKYGFIKKA